MKKLGFGLMRLPTVNGNWAEIDMEKSREMIDAYMKEFHKEIPISIRYVVGLHNPHVFTSVEIF